MLNTAIIFQRPGAWTFMACYWAGGCLLWYSLGYAGAAKMYRLHFFEVEVVEVLSNANIAYVTALMATLAANVAYAMRARSFGRPYSLPAAVLFAILNGIFETPYFMSTFDFGVSMAKIILPHSLAIADDGAAEISMIHHCHFAAGFVAFSIFSGLIHLHFWDKICFPVHLAATTKPQPPYFIFGVTLMSFIWMTLYFYFHATTTLFILHIIMDFCGASIIHLQPPWASLKEKPSSKQL